ncbi:MAG: HD domain-containing phosphohydrolase [Candidatus Eremiobacteraeota bacterium]|nr:HD domain-containing phosphohydrolase [Candidatus Eremiobacteraeota bacterium]
MSIKMRLLIALIPAMLIFLALLIYFGSLSERLLRLEHRQVVRIIATSYGVRFSTIVDSASTIADILGDSMEAEPALTEEFVNKLAQKIMVERTAGISGLCVSLEPGIIGKGEFALYFKKPPAEKKEAICTSLATREYDYRNREWYRTAMESGKGFWTEAYFDKGGGDELVISYCSPVLIKNKTAGVIRADLSVSELAGELREFKITENGLAFLVTDKGRCIGSSEDTPQSGDSFWSDEKFLKDPDTPRLLKKLEEGKSSSIKLNNPITGEESRFYIRPVAPLKLNLVFVSALKDLHAPTIRLNYILIGICGAFIALAAVLIVMISSSVAKPLEKLVKQAEDYSSGNFESRLDEQEGPGEIKKLSRAFNAMGEEIGRKLHELREAQKEIVLHLGKAAEYRDTDTGFHIWRMSQYCGVLAKACGMKKDEWDLFLHASPMHDIGKIGISDNILLKPGELDEDEYSVMKTHTTIGTNILAEGKSQLLRIAQVVANYHHEKWDGSGYPHGLKGEEIPLMARIACIADVFDALTMKRPYKRAWTVEEALTELKEKSGQDFDPALVALFIEHLDEILAIREHFKDEMTE